MENRINKSEEKMFHYQNIIFYFLPLNNSQKLIFRTVFDIKHFKPKYV